MGNNLSCADFEVLLADWIDEAPMADADSVAIREHLESCAACAGLAADARSALSFITRAAEVEVPEALVSKILHGTNSGWEFKLRGRGLSGWINRTFAPVLRPRVVMGAMLTLISATMLMRCGGAHEMTAAQLDPIRVWTSLDDRAHRIWERAVKSYESMRLVYEVRAQIEEWAAQQRQEDDAAADAQANQRKLQQAPDPTNTENRK